eukprot:13165058-Alexandrium_andersonii.AAC.1
MIGAPQTTFWAEDARTCSWAACMYKLAPPHEHQLLAARAEPRHPDYGHEYPRTNTSSNDGLAIMATGVIAVTAALHVQRAFGA